MGLFGSLFGKSKQQSVAVAMRETLFGDSAIDQWPPKEGRSDLLPWTTFVAARTNLAAGNQSAAVASWQEILKQPGLESRHYLQAWHFLRQHGQQPPMEVAKEVLGVVVEVGMPQGLDVLAAYPDHSARYYNYSGAGVVWERTDSSLDSVIDQLLSASAQVVAQIGPWEDVRPVPPPRDHIRISFLTPSGLHFGQGPFAALAKDPIGGQVVYLAANLMKLLIAKTNPNSNLN